MKVLIDVGCKECEMAEEMWADEELIEMIGEGRLYCDDCLHPLHILLGVPQFSIKGEGVYDPGKH